MRHRAFMTGAVAVVGLLAPWAAHAGGLRFPPPDFEEHQLPEMANPMPHGAAHEWLAIALLILALGVSTYFIYKKRSRWGVIGVAIFSLMFFGFYRHGCPCPVASVQNVSLALFGGTYTIPLTIVVLFAAPLVFALFVGRVFCASVCPMGVMQELVLLRPVKVPGWLDRGLGLIPYFYLGAVVLFAATGSAFLICEVVNPFLPLYRMSDEFAMLLLGGAVLGVSMVIGRPYCRYLCPYGVLLRLASRVAKWRVTITPNVCTQCSLCHSACPYGAIHTPAEPGDATDIRRDRRRVAWLIVALPFLIAGGGWIGSKLGTPASMMHPTVRVAEQYLTAKTRGTEIGSPELEDTKGLALLRADQAPAALLGSAQSIRDDFVLGGWLVGAWAGLAVGGRMIAFSFRRRRRDYEPDPGDCYACARCFPYCPEEQDRRAELRTAAPVAQSREVGVGSIPGVGRFCSRAKNRKEATEGSYERRETGRS